MKTILITVSGMSPAIITETLWALAQEKPAVVPDEIVVITTQKGEMDIEQQLLQPNHDWQDEKVWERLRKDIFNKVNEPKGSQRLQLGLRVIEFPDAATGIKQKAWDVRSKEQNKETADFILRVLGPYMKDDHHVIASIAGGRKTMGALLYAGMSLVGRETDRVTHVLVDDPFDMTRGFFYPEQPKQDLSAMVDGKLQPVKARDAGIELANIPFVPLRNRFTELKEPDLSFEGLVQRYSKAARSTTGPPRVLVSEIEEWMVVDNRKIVLSQREWPVAFFLYRRALEKEPHLANYHFAWEPFAKFFTEWIALHPQHRSTQNWSLRENTFDADLKRPISSMRTTLKKAGLADVIPYLLPEGKRIGFDMVIP